MKKTIFKKVIVGGFGLSLLTLAISSSGQQAIDIATTPDEWFAQGKQTIAKKVRAARFRPSPSFQRAKNVIIFLGDGMGMTTLTAARIFEGQMNGTEGEDNELFFENFPNTALVKTYNTDVQTPDSAGTMTAIMTGVKTDSGTIGVNQNVINGDCSSEAGTEQITALEMAEKIGMSTGVVSTARITHATPASTYAHSMSRGFEDDHDGAPSYDDDGIETAPGWINEGCLDIAQQMIEMPALMGVGNGLEVAMGGGRRSFLPRTEGVDPETGGRGERDDMRDLTAEWLDNYENSDYVWDKIGFDAIDTENTDHLLGLFEASHMQYETDREYDVFNDVAVEATEPSLAEMTETAIAVLDNNRKGFFLVVEGGRIDHAHHDTNPYRALRDTVAFADAVQAAYENTNPRETLIIVTADHSHVMTMGGGYNTPKGNPILGISATAFDGLPMTSLNYTTGYGFEMENDPDSPAVIGRVDLTGVDVESPHFHPESPVLYFEYHGSEDVVAFATGPGSYLVNGLIEQNVLFHVVNEAAHLNRPRSGRRGW